MRIVHHPTVALFTLVNLLCAGCGNTGDSATIGSTETATSSSPESSSAPPQTSPPSTPSTSSPSPATPAPATTEPAEAAETDSEMGTAADTDAAGSDVGTDMESVMTDDGSAMVEDSDPQMTEPPAEPQEECTDIPDPEQSCQQRLEWGNCEQQWMIDGGFCNRTCGRCQGAQPGADDGGGDNGGTPNTPGELGDDNPYQPIQGGQQGNSTRYWDCCKQSCGWTANASQPVSSCDFNNNNIGVNDSDRNVCDGGNATTCHGMAPWAHSTQVAYGYAAANGAGCGTCWQLQFTGSSSTTPNDEGSAAISGKTMVVMATNIGDLNGQLHFDLLIPGGGLGLNNGCTTSLGIPEGELGANRGGFLTECAGAGSLDGKKQCVRDKCANVFGSRGLTDLEAGCLWFVDWFQVADNPDFLVQQIDCPSELRQFN